MLPLLCLFAVIGLGYSGVAAQETDDLILGIEDVEAFARISSPRLRVTSYEIDVVDAERKSRWPGRIPLWRTIMNRPIRFSSGNSP